MDSQLVRMGFDYTRKRRSLVLVLGALGFTGYGAYRVYQSPSVVDKRRKLLRLLGAVVSVAEDVSDSAETIGVLSKDLKQFIQSDSDQIPNSLTQIAKIAKSDEFSQSLTRVTKALTVGILRGYRSESRKSDDSSFSDQAFEKLFSKAGSGFASVVVGSFARNLVMALYSDELINRGGGDSELPGWVNVVSDDRCKELVGDCIRLFVGTAVAVYLDKTMHINTYDELFSGLTNPKNEKKMKEMLTSICNGAVETLVKTSNQVMTTEADSNPNNLKSFPTLSIDGFGSDYYGGSELKPWDDSDNSGWMSKMSSSLAVPSNRKLVLDVTGKVTFEMVRSCLEYLQEKVGNGVKRTFHVVKEEVVEAVTYLTEQSSVVLTICVSVLLHILGGVWVLVPA